MRCEEAKGQLQQQQQQQQQQPETETETETKQRQRHLLLDVRDAGQFEMCHLDGAVNVPLPELRNALEQRGGAWPEALCGDDVGAIYVICRRGVASRAAVQALLEGRGSPKPPVVNVRGGLAKWSADVDSAFPAY